MYIRGITLVTISVGRPEKFRAESNQDHSVTVVTYSTTSQQRRYIDILRPFHRPSQPEIIGNDDCADVYCRTANPASSLRW
jgi:hypothetical protein